jgi:TRAP-type mannitol/chloroaromatic compound transport system permease large subunit
VGFVGSGFTVIEKVPAGPGQLLAVGVTVNVLITGLFVEFVNVVLVIVPLPLAAIPIED